MKVEAHSVPTERHGAGARIDYDKSLDCIHCGLCLNACPTYRMSGREEAGPRGRVFLMRALAESRIEVDPDLRESLDSCLVCRGCESVCPAGVQFGPMMEVARDALEEALPRGAIARLARRIGFSHVLPKPRVIAFVASAIALAQRTGLAKLAGVFGRAGSSLAAMPTLPPRAERGRMPAELPAEGTEHGVAWMLEGCVMPELFGDVNRATAKVLAASGHRVRTVAKHRCCGALHAHNGELDGAVALARQTIEAFEAAGGDEPIVVNSAGCGAHMLVYPELFEDEPQWRARAERFSARVLDFSRFVARPDVLERLRARLEASSRSAEGGGDGARSPGDAISAGGAGASRDSKAGANEHLRITYDDPCHLCHGQGVRGEPRTLLDALPGVERVDLASTESCCGSAGIFSLLRPVDSERILAPKLDELEHSNANVLVTANPGCHLQWASGAKRRGLERRVAHIAELIAERLD